MNTPLHFSPFTDLTIARLAVQANFSDGYSHGRDGENRGAAHDLNDALEQRLTGVPEWWERSHIPGIHHVSGVEYRAP